MAEQHKAEVRNSMRFHYSYPTLLLNPGANHFWGWCNGLGRFMRFRGVFIFVVVSIWSSAVYGAGVIHVDNAAPNGFVCRNKFVLVKLLTFVNGIQVGEYVGLGAQFGSTMESKINHVKCSILTASDPPDCCITPRNKLAGGAFIVYRGSCSLTAMANNAEAAGASTVLIVNNDADILRMLCEDDADIKINIPVVILPLDVGEELEALLSNNMTVSVQLYSKRHPSILFTQVFPWIMAVGTILCASYWSVWSSREAAIERDKQNKHYDKALAEAADQKLVLLYEIANCEDIMESLEEKANVLENLCTEEMCKMKELEAELDLLKNHHDKTLAEAAAQKLVLQNKATKHKQKIKALKEKVDAHAELVKHHEVERDEAIKLSKELAESKADYFLTLSSSEILKAAVQSDQPSHLLCEGELGNVYKAVLYHTEVTLRFLPEDKLLAFEYEVKILSKFRHPNLATLLGACPDTMVLVYEHLPNGSLEDRIRCKDDTRPLSWQTRIRIAVELCSALIFLHSHGVIHGALRPSCVLLDPNFTCKIIDFQFCKKGESSSSTASNYTGEYADPELLASPSSDVYSFGLMLLELLTRKPGFSVVEEVKSCLEQGSLNSLLDTSAGELSYVLAQQLAHLGLRCCHTESTRRPDLASDVWKVLEPIMRSCGSVLSSRFGEAPSYFVCPITLEVMEDPHVAEDGYTYEAEAMKLWLDRDHNTSPMTNLPLDSTRLVPNRSLHSAIQEWRQLQQR